MALGLRRKNRGDLLHCLCGLIAHAITVITLAITGITLATISLAGAITLDKPPGFGWRRSRAAEAVPLEEEPR